MTKIHAKFTIFLGELMPADCYLGNSGDSCRGHGAYGIDEVLKQRMRSSTKSCCGTLVNNLFIIWKSARNFERFDLQAHDSKVNKTSPILIQIKQQNPVIRDVFWKHWGIFWWCLFLRLSFQSRKLLSKMLQKLLKMGFYFFYGSCIWLNC